MSQASPLDLWRRVESVVSHILKKTRLGHYVQDCTRDILFLHHGLRPSFVTDVIAPSEVWVRMIQELIKVDASFSDICVLDLCDEGCFLLRTSAFHQKLTTHLQAIGATTNESDHHQTDATIPGPSVSKALPQWIRVHSLLPEPMLCRGEEYDTMNQHLATVIRYILTQINAAKSQKNTSNAPLCLSLPSLHDTPSSTSNHSGSDVNLLSAIRALSLPALCGYLLEYPVLYCTSLPPAARDTAAALASFDSSHDQGNNLSMRPLRRMAAEVQVRPEMKDVVMRPMKKKPSVAASVTACGSADVDTTGRTLLCSFTVPINLLSEPAVTAAIDHWSADRRSATPDHASSCCWLSPVEVRSVDVELPFVAL